jgi:hypothetical protein
VARTVPLSPVPIPVSISQAPYLAPYLHVAWDLRVAKTVSLSPVPILASPVSVYQAPYLAPSLHVAWYMKGARTVSLSYVPIPVSVSQAPLSCSLSACCLGSEGCQNCPSVSCPYSCLCLPGSLSCSLSACCLGSEGWPELSLCLLSLFLSLLSLSPRFPILLPLCMLPEI